MLWLYKNKKVVCKKMLSVLNSVLADIFHTKKIAVIFFLFTFMR